MLHGTKGDLSVKLVEQLIKQEKLSREDGNILYPDCGGGEVKAHICQHSLTCTPKSMNSTTFKIYLNKPN